MAPLERLGRYQIVGILGHGAMGVVYKGYDPVIARTVALKTIRKDMLGGEQVEDAIGRFRNEAMASGRLNHPGIIGIHEYGEYEGTVFIVMEYAPGDTLRGYISRRDSIKLLDIFDVMAQLLDALGYAHENGIIHRDIKPGNIIVSDSGQVKVTDFGIARINTSSITQTGMMVGTPSYMAPEQYIGLAIDRRVDVFAAGVVLYELLTGVKPFEGTTEAVAYKICHGAHSPPSLVNAMLPPGLDDVLARALAKKPDERFSTAREFSMHLRDVVRNHEDTASDATVVLNNKTLRPVVASTQELSSLSVKGWPPGAFAALEAAFAPYVGPLARSLIKRNAERVFTQSELRDKLSLAIVDLAERKAFLEDSQPIFDNLEQLPNVNSLDRSVTSTKVQIGVRPDDIDRAIEDLTKFIGPIAKVLVKKASFQAVDLKELYSRLAEHLDTAEEKAAFKKLRGF